MPTVVDVPPSALEPHPSPPKPRRRPLLSILAIAAGALVLVAAGLWKAFAVDALVRFPTDVDLRPRYEGTLTTFVDVETSAPLGEPAVVPLAVDRHVEAIADESTDDTVLVRESIALSIDGVAAAEQVHQYVMDRKDNTNVADERAWAYEPANVLDRSGAHWVALPMGSDGSQAVAMFKDEIGTTFQARGAGATEDVAGVRLVAFDATGVNVPITEAYKESLGTIAALPDSITFEQLKPSLVGAGVPVDDLLAAVVAVASPEDIQALVALTAEPIPLEYVMSFSGRTFIEPDTGAVVDVGEVVERVSARPGTEALPPLLAILDRYQSEPVIAESIAALGALASQPLPVFEYRYAQVPASVDEVASWVADQRGQKQLAESTIPIVLTVAGGALLLVGSAAMMVRVWRRPR